MINKIEFDFVFTEKIYETFLFIHKLYCETDDDDFS